AEARPILEEARTIFAALENAPLQASILLELAALSAREGDQAKGLADARAALDLVNAGAWPLQQLYAHLRLVDLYLPAVDRANDHATAAVELASALSVPHLRYRAHQRLGRVRLLQGRVEEAEAELNTAITFIEELRTNLLPETLRTSFLHDKLAAYEDLMRLYLQRYLQTGVPTLVEQAFALAEQARSRVLIERMTGLFDWDGTAEEATATTAGDPAIQQRLQQLQHDLNAIYNQLLLADDPTSTAAINPGERATRMVMLQHQATEYEQEIQRLQLQVLGHRTTDPTAHILPTFAAPTLNQRWPQLQPQEMMLVYYTLDDEIMAFMLTPQGLCQTDKSPQQPRLHLARHVGSVNQVNSLLQQLNVQWARMRADPAFVERHGAMLERSAQRVLTLLHDELMRPLTAWLDNFAMLPNQTAPQRLIIVPHGILHQVPFQALHDGKGYLLEAYEVTYAPSVTTDIIAQTRQPAKQGRALVMGVADVGIPAVQQEIESVANQFGDAHVFLDESATLAQLKAHAAQSPLIHLACHGIFRADNPMFSAVHLSDGWLTAAEIAELHLPGALVVLSACESGRGSVVGGDEIIGLLRAFLGAGAATVVATQWVVQDAATAKLMHGWYMDLAAGMAPSTALRRAQLALRHDYAHPYHWAPFVLVGSRTSQPTMRQWDTHPIGANFIRRLG
ncbi:MAG: CHAT domain-containing protein, partial [Caldilineaceae bacterium]|nr:CHAT domain-containing protein [Caldilineaceae bacterium]